MSDDLTPAELRRHPVTQVLRAAAAGGLPSEPELDALRLSPSTRRKVSDAAIEAASFKASGQNKIARDRADGSADRIVNDLPQELRSPDYLRPPEAEPDDPQSLADLVGRR